MDKIPKILFLTRGSASRGEMAEGFLRRFAGRRFLPCSAGTEASSVNPLALEVMQEAGIDISGQRPRDIRSLFQESFQFVVTLYDETRERYPVFPFARQAMRWAIPDPEAATGTPDMVREAFRRVRDQLRNEVARLAGVHHRGGDGTGAKAA